MITYCTNLMGPCNWAWMDKHGDNWATGRIDVYGLWNGEHALALPPMDYKDWNNFSRWLDTLETEDIYSLEQLVKLYEKTNSKITWLKTPKWEK